MQIGVSGKTAYDLFLTRSLEHAKLVRMPDTPTAAQKLASGSEQGFTSAQQAIRSEDARGLSIAP